MKPEEKILLTALKYRRIMFGELVGLTGYPEQLVWRILRNNSERLRIVGEEITVKDPISIAMELLNRGVGLRVVSENLSWQDFELVSSQLLVEFGLEVIHGVKVATPTRFEIDVLGLDSVTGLSLAIDCKHWSVASPSKLAEAATKHLERVDKFVRYYPYVTSKYRFLERVKEIIPLIVTLLTPTLRVHRGVLILSIGELPHFVRERHNVIDFFGVTPIRVSRRVT